MVLLAKWILENKPNARVLILTDRDELDKQKADEEASGALTSKVTAIATPPNGGLVVTLENGQVWQQKTADRGMHVKVGDQVTIKHALMGSFLLTSDTVKGSMRVTRVK